MKNKKRTSVFLITGLTLLMVGGLTASTILLTNRDSNDHNNQNTNPPAHITTATNEQNQQAKQKLAEIKESLERVSKNGEFTDRGIDTNDLKKIQTRLTTFFQDLKLTDQEKQALQPIITTLQNSITKILDYLNKKPTTLNDQQKQAFQNIRQDKPSDQAKPVDNSDLNYLEIKSLINELRDAFTNGGRTQIRVLRNILQEEIENPFIFSNPKYQPIIEKAKEIIKEVPAVLTASLKKELEERIVVLINSYFLPVSDPYASVKIKDAIWRLNFSLTYGIEDYTKLPNVVQRAKDRIAQKEQILNYRDRMVVLYFNLQSLKDKEKNGFGAYSKKNVRSDVLDAVEAFTYEDLYYKAPKVEGRKLSALYLEREAKRFLWETNSRNPKNIKKTEETTEEPTTP